MFPCGVGYLSHVNRGHADTSKKRSSDPKKDNSNQSGELNMNNVNTFTSIQADLSSWVPMKEIPARYPQFTQAQISRLFWKREEHKGLSRCYRQVGKRGFVCLPLFAQWMLGELPEQKESIKQEGK